MAWCEIWTSRTKHLLAHVYSAAACSNPCKDVLFSLSQNIKPFSATLHCNWADKQPLTHFLGGATTKQNMAMQGWPPTNDYKEWMWSFCFFSAIFLPIFVWVFFFPSNGSLRVNSSQVGETRFPHNAVGLDVSCSATRVALCWKTQSGTPNSLMERTSIHSLSGGFSSTLTVICWKAMAHNFEKDVRSFCMNLKIMGEMFFSELLNKLSIGKLGLFKHVSSVHCPFPLIILFAGKFGRLWVAGGGWT